MVKEGAGKPIGDKKTEKEGVVEKVVVKAKEAVEDAKDVTEGITDGAKNTTNKDKKQPRFSPSDGRQ